MSSYLLALVVLNAVPPSPAEQGHDVMALLTPSGLAFLGDALPRYVPRDVALPSIEYELMTCDGDRKIRWHQEETTFNLALDDLTLSLPRTDTVRVRVELSVTTGGTMRIENAFACFGELSCKDQLRVSSVVLTADLVKQSPTGGALAFEATNVDISYDADLVELRLDDCVADDLANWIVELAKEELLSTLEWWLEGWLAEAVTPLIAEQLAGLTRWSGHFDFALFSAEQNGVGIGIDGIYVNALADIWTPYPPADCIDAAHPEPAPRPGDPSEVTAQVRGDLALAFNLGLFEDLLYHLWYHGLTCMSDEHLRALGMELDLAPLLSVIPGFPPGTVFRIQFRLTEPPTITSSKSDGAQLSLALGDVVIELVGELPDGTKRVIALTAAAQADARLRLRPVSNAIVMQINTLELELLSLDDDGIGIDALRFADVLRDHLVPQLLNDWQELPLMGPVVSFTDYSILPSVLRTTNSHLIINASLFQAPADDSLAPDTLWAQSPPQEPVRPAQAILHVRGVDESVPAELILFEVTVDGELQSSTYMNDISFGKIGETEVYAIEIRAKDMSGNRDETPLRTTMVIDGVKPRISWTSELLASRAPGPFTVSWQAFDDWSTAAQMTSRLQVYRLRDPADSFSGELIEEQSTQGGVFTAQVSLPSGGSYQLLLQVSDGAGNTTSLRAPLNVESEAESCRQAGDSAAWVVLLAFVATFFGRRRSRSP